MTGHSLPELVAAHPVMRGLPGDTAELVAGCARNAAFGPGALILAEGERADTLYLLRRGRVALEMHAPGHGPLLVQTIEAPSVVGWSWLFAPYRWRLDARALGPVGAIAVDAACLRAKADADPAFGYALMQRFAADVLERLQATRLRLLDVYGDRAGGR